MHDSRPTDEQAFRAAARAWLEANATPKQSSPLPSSATTEAEVHAERVRQAKAWQVRLADERWACIAWPREYGGGGLTPRHQAIFDEEQSQYAVPASVFMMGIGMAGPTLLSHGTDEQKRRFLPPMLRGEEVWCQLFSEPGAGSDLASLATRAVRDGDEFVINGQKVWTSNAHFSDWGILLARTDPDVPKHRGISFFLVDMRAPGVDVRPLRQPNGRAHFNEVFLTDVRIPAEHLVGPLNEGWRVTITTLANERTAIGGMSTDEMPGLLASYRSRQRDAATRDRFVRAYIQSRLIALMRARAKAAAASGKDPGPEGSLLKLAVSVQHGVLGDLAVDLEGADGMLFEYGDPERHSSTSGFLLQWMARIGGGTEQIQRNIIGERILGLPREPSVDRDVPFRDLPGHT